MNISLQDCGISSTIETPLVLGFWKDYITSLVQDCSNSIPNTLELL